MNHPQTFSVLQSAHTSVLETPNLFIFFYEETTYRLPQFYVFTLFFQLEFWTENQPST